MFLMFRSFHTYTKMSIWTLPFLTSSSLTALKKKKKKKKKSSRRQYLSDILIWRQIWQSRTCTSVVATGRRQAVIARCGDIIVMMVVQLWGTKAAPFVPGPHWWCALETVSVQVWEAGKVCETVSVHVWEAGKVCVRQCQYMSERQGKCVWDSAGTGLRGREGVSETVSVHVWGREGVCETVSVQVWEAGKVCQTVCVYVCVGVGGECQVWSGEGEGLVWMPVWSGDGVGLVWMPVWSGEGQRGEIGSLSLH